MRPSEALESDAPGCRIAHRLGEFGFAGQAVQLLLPQKSAATMAANFSWRTFTRAGSWPRMSASISHKATRHRFDRRAHM
jgi:hypothetical protein